MSEGNSVSVVIPCHNHGQYLMDAVDSVLAQTWRDLEVIIVDDGSDDPETIRIIDAVRLPRTRMIRQPNLKLPAARNAGIAASAGAYICCLDADDKLEPSYIEKCMHHLVAEGYDICGSWQRNFGTEDAVHRPGRFDFPSLLKSNRMIYCAMFPKRLWELAGGFDPAMEDGYEDWEFWIRLASLGARAWVIPEPLFLYRKHGRSKVDAARERHDELVTRIRSKYQGVIPGPGNRYR
jgi:glycosyltransferase involved in cell wall biosynthesis